MLDIIIEYIKSPNLYLGILTGIGLTLLIRWHVRDVIREELYLHELKRGKNNG